MTHLILFTVVILATFCFVIWRVIRRGLAITTVDDYLYAHERGKLGLPRTTVWRTAVASNFQTANVLVIGIYFGYSYGLLMLWLPITFASGVGLLWFLALDLKKKSTASLNQVFQSDELPYNRLFSNLPISLAFILNFFIYSALLVSAVLEIWLGSELVRDIAAPILSEANLEGLQKGRRDIITVALFFAAFLFAYVYVGGYRAVAETDILQFALIVIMLTLLILGVILETISVPVFDWAALITGTGAFFSDPVGFWALVIGAFVLNTFWQLVEPQQWQRARTATDGPTYVESLGMATIGTFLTWAAPIVVGAILAGAAITTEESVHAAYPFHAFFRLALDQEVFAYLATCLVGLATAGVFAAALSSADTAIIAFLARVASLQGLGENLPEIRKRAVPVTIVVFIAAGILHLSAFELDRVIFAVFTGQILFAPMFVAYITSGGTWRLPTPMAAYCTIFAFSLSWIGAVALNSIPDAEWQHAGFLFPALVIGAGIFLVQRYPFELKQPFEASDDGRSDE